MRDSPTININWRDLKGAGATDEEKPPKLAYVFLYSNLILSVGLDQVAVLE